MSKVGVVAGLLIWLVVASLHADDMRRLVAVRLARERTLIPSSSMTSACPKQYPSKALSNRTYWAKVLQLKRDEQGGR